MRRSVLLLFSAFAAVAVVQSANAQKFVPKSIQFNGDPEFSNQELMQATGLKKGEVLDYVSMNTVAQQLMNTGMFDGVTFKFDGQDLIFYLTPASQLLPVKLDNLPFAAGEDVNAKLRSRLPLYHGKVPPAGGLTNEVGKDLESMLAADGIHADVQGIASGTLGSTQASAMAYSILSPPVLVHVARVDGVSQGNESEVQAVLADITKNPFDASTSADNLRRGVQLFYEDHGYAAVKVEIARAGNAEATADSILVPFTVSVQEGRVYKLGDVRVPAGAPVTQADVEKDLARHPAGVIPGLRLRSALGMIAASYKSKGFLDCKITPRPLLDDAAGTVTYAVDADPGPQYHLGFVKFDDMSEQTRMLLMRYWQLMPGDVYNQGYVYTFIPEAKRQDRTLANMLADAKVNYVETEDLQNHTVNLVVHLNRLPPSTAQ
ncbi:MAG TPA: POTRA domain-containing protein [Terracidiphilus sp.]